MTARRVWVRQFYGETRLSTACANAAFREPFQYLSGANLRTNPYSKVSQVVLGATPRRMAAAFRQDRTRNYRGPDDCNSIAHNKTHREKCACIAKLYPPSTNPQRGARNRPIGQLRLRLPSTRRLDRTSTSSVQPRIFVRLPPQTVSRKYAPSRV